MALNNTAPTTFTTAVLIADTVATTGSSNDGISTMSENAGGSTISAALEVQSTEGGFVPPRMTDTQIAAIDVPIAGMQVYSTTQNAMQVYQNGAFVSTSTIQQIEGTLTNANIVNMFATPVAIPALAAPGAGQMIVIHDWALNLSYGTVALANGGAISLQYGNTAQALGPLASGSIAAATLTPAGNRYLNANGVCPAVITTANAINTAIYITNATAAFITGSATTTVKYKIWYSVIDAV